MELKRKDGFSMPVIEVNQLTKDYGYHRGVFDVTFQVEQGEVFGFLGPNGAGKTTTIRHLMGFSKPQSGTIKVSSKDSWKDAAAIKREVGYLPGELAFPKNMTGTAFIDFMAKERRISDMTKTNHLIDMFELDVSPKLDTMSLGTRRKVAIVTAFMHDPDILVLDEPTSGLDPVMQERFIEFILEEKRAGKSILLSSHIFSEVDATCDRIAIIKEGEVVSTVVADDIRKNENKTYKVEFVDENEYQRFVENSMLNITVKRPSQNQVKIEIKDENIKDLFTELSQYQLNFITEMKFSLEDYFMNFYDTNKSVSAGEEVLSHGVH